MDSPADRGREWQIERGLADHQRGVTDAPWTTNKPEESMLEVAHRSWMLVQLEHGYAQMNVPSGTIIVEIGYAGV